MNTDMNMNTNARRELARKYKETGPRAGVYVIRNERNGRFLLGGSLNVDGALNRERFELQLKSHRNRELLGDWLRFGDEAFSFEVIDLVKKRDDPAFDPQAELDGLLALWREELAAHGGEPYPPLRAKSAGLATMPDALKVP